jgi:hypothetical protein
MVPLILGINFRVLALKLFIKPMLCNIGWKHGKVNNVSSLSQKKTSSHEQVSMYWK